MWIVCCLCPSLLFMSLSVFYALIALIYHPTTIYVINQNSDYLF